MKREQFLRRLRKEAKELSLSFEVDKKLGKGSHYRVKVGDRKSTVPSGDLSPRLMSLIRKQLGFD